MPSNLIDTISQMFAGLNSGGQGPNGVPVPSGSISPAVYDKLSNQVAAMLATFKAPTLAPLHVGSGTYTVPTTANTQSVQQNAYPLDPDWSKLIQNAGAAPSPWDPRGQFLGGGYFPMMPNIPLAGNMGSTPSGSMPANSTPGVSDTQH